MVQPAMAAGKGTLGATVLATALVAIPASAGPLDDVHIGPAVTIEAGGAYEDGLPYPVSGTLYAQVGLIVEEFAHPIPYQQIDVLVDDAVEASDTTGPDGAYSVSLVFGSGAPTTRRVRAVAFKDTAAETSSREVVTSIDRFPIELSLDPPSVVIGAGSSVQLTAWALMDDGRLDDATARAAWSSSDPGVATVGNSLGNKGLVTGVAGGTATITAVYGDTSATATITVE